MTTHTDTLSVSLYQGYEPVPYIAVNGELMPSTEAQVSPLDHGFMHGDGCFEALVVTDGLLFCLDAHLARMRRSLQALRIEFDVDVLAGQIGRTVAANGLADAFVKAIVTRGAGPAPSLDPRGLTPTSVIFAERPMLLVEEDAFHHGLTLKTSALRRPGPDVLDPKIKSLNYLNPVLAKIEALEAGAHEALILDTHGEVAEGTSENIFIVRDGGLITPSSPAVLEGITRMVIEQIADAHGVPCVRDRVTLGDVYSADEVFLSSTAGGVIPVGNVDGRIPRHGANGPITRRLSDWYETALRDPGFTTPVAQLTELVA